MKRIIATLIIIMMVFTLFGCNRNDILDETAKTDESGEVIIDKDEDIQTPVDKTPPPREVTVTDSVGREVTTSSENGDIVSVGKEATSLLIALGAKGRLTGVEEDAAYNKLFLKAFPEITEVKAVTSGDNVLVDEIIAQKPGLVVLTQNDSTLLKSFADADITCAVVTLDSVESIKQSIELMGSLSNTDEKASKLSKYYDSALSKIKVLTMTEEKQTVTVFNDNKLLSELIKNLSCELIPNGKYVIANKDEAIEGAITVPDSIERWDEPSTALVLALYWFAHNIYPNAVSRNEVSQRAINFYAEFYGIKLTPEEVGIPTSENIDS